MSFWLIIVSLILTLTPPGFCQSAPSSLTPSQHEALECIVAWLRQNPGRLPKRRDFHHQAGGIAVPYHQLMAGNDYAPGGRYHKLAIFDNPQHFWQQLKAFARAQDLPVRLLGFPFHEGLHPETRAILQQEALEVVSSWMKEAKRKPKAADFINNGGTLPLHHSRLTGTRQYNPLTPYYGSRIFDSSQAFNEALEKLWQELAIEVPTVIDNAPPRPSGAAKRKAPSQTPHPVLNNAQSQARAAAKQKEQLQALQVVLDWITNPLRGHDQTPRARDFESGVFPFSYEKLVANSTYRSDGRANRAALFTSAEEFWLALHFYAQAKGVEVCLLNVTFKTKFSRELLNILRDQANTRVLEWIRTHQRLPNSEDFGVGPNQLHLSYRQIMGVNHYAPGQTLNDFALFESPQHFWLQFKEFARSKQLAIRLLSIKLSGDLSPGLKSALRDEVLDEVMAWIRNPNGGNGRLPRPRDFINSRGSISVSYQRLFESHRDSRSTFDNCLFLSPEELNQALQSKLSQMQNSSTCSHLIDDAQSNKIE